MLGFVALAHCGLSLGTCLLISHHYLVLPSSSWHPWGHLPGVAPATTPQSGSGLQSHGPFCQLSPLSPPSCTETVWTQLTSRASLLQGCQCWGAEGVHPSAPGLSPAPVDRGSWVGVRMSWESLWLVSWSLSRQDLSRAGVKPCLEGSGGDYRAGQQGRGLPAPALPRAHRLSRQPGLLTSSCAGLHLNPPSCLISKANSLTDKSVSCSCLGPALWLCHHPVSQRQG